MPGKIKLGAYALDTALQIYKNNINVYCITYYIALLHESNVYCVTSWNLPEINR